MRRPACSPPQSRAPARLGSPPRGSRSTLAAQTRAGGSRRRRRRARGHPGRDGQFGKTAAGRFGRDLPLRSEAGRYDCRSQAPETDFFGQPDRAMGRHADDIVPPFTIEQPAARRPELVRRAELGRRGTARSRRTAARVGAGTALRPSRTTPEPSKKVRICHATSSNSNPYVSNEPAIANNGDLQGGHLNHTGPVYPEKGWGDISAVRLRGRERPDADFPGGTG